MEYYPIVLLVLLFIALPIIAVVRSFRLSRRISDLESRTESQGRISEGVRELTVRVFALEERFRVLQARTAAAAPPTSAPETEAPRAGAPEVPVTPEPVAAKPGAVEAAPAQSEPESVAAYASSEPLLFASYGPPPTTSEAPEAEAGAEAPRDLETNIGLIWINRVAAVTLILAAAFFFKYAVDNQWIGETGRIVLGVIAGFAALGGGEWAWRRGHRAYAQGVTALGIAVLYLSFYAAFAFYHLPATPQSVAFALMALTAAMGGALAMRYDAAVISVLAMLGGYLTPVLLSTSEDRPWVLFSYILLLDLGALAVGRAKQWRHLAPLAMTGTSLLYMAWFGEHFNPSKQLVATVFALVYYALFALLESKVLMALAQILASAALLAIGAAVGPGESWVLSNGWVFVGLAAAGVAVGERHRWPDLTRVTMLSFWFGFGLWQGASLPRPHPGMVAPAAIAGFALFLGYLAWRIIVRREKAGVDALAMMALNAAVAFGVVYHQLDTSYHAWLGLAAAGFAGIHLLVAAQIWNRSEEGEERDTTPVLLLLGVALAFLTLAVPLQFSQYRITIAWALEGAALAWIGRRAGARRLSQSALVVFGLTLIRLLTLDAWIYGNGSQYDLLANARFLTFAVAAASLWLSVQWLDDQREKLAAYIAGHFVLLWTLVMEVVGQAERSVQADKVFSVGSVSVSVLIAAYGVILIGAFVLGRFTVNRLLGLILLGGVVLKLYLHDVWVLERIYRVVAFGFLGILLLLTSFLYSRYRTKIGDWWKDDTGPG